MAKERKKKALRSASVDSKAAPGTLENEGKSPLENWADDETSAAYEAAKKFYKIIVAGYRNQEDRGDEIEAAWNIYNCIPDMNQGYAGNSTCYVPAVRDAINARAKRIVKQLFPISHRHVDAITEDNKIPYTELSMIEHNISRTELKDLSRTGLVAGDVTGQWNFYIDYTKSYRKVTKLVLKAPKLSIVDGESVVKGEVHDPIEDEEETLETEDVCEEGPEVVPFADEDLFVYPPTASSIQKAQMAVMRLRMSEDAVARMVDEGVFILPEGCADAHTFFEREEPKSKGRQKRDPDKKAVHDAGIKTEGTVKYALVYECWCRLDLGGKHKEEAVVYFVGEDEIIGIIKNPYWSGKRPIISAPIDKIEGSFKGRSKIEPVKYMQWNLNDFWNLGQDSALYSQMPVFAANPMSNPNWATMVLGLAAVWPIAPDDIKALTFPQLYKESMTMCEGIKRQIWESLDVNETMMGKMPQGRKNNQLMGAMQQEQQVNIIDVAERFETQVLNPIVEWFHELDLQFRTKSVMVQARGEIGVKASMIKAEPQQWGQRILFQWWGTKAVAGMQLLQQQIGFLNVLKGTPPAMLDGRRLNILPILEKGVESLFGPEVASKIFIDERDLFTVSPEIENEMLHNGLEVDVNPGDNDIEHIKSHTEAVKLAGDPMMVYKKHIVAHIQAMKKKQQQQMAMQQQMVQGAPGAPGGGQAPGAAGTPPGALPGQSRNAVNPPGAIHQDQMMDGNVMARG